MVRFTILSAAALLGLSPSQSVNAQFSIYDDSSFLDATLGESCIAALTAPIDCSPYVQTFQRLSYRGDLDVALTDSICTAGCLYSLKTWFDTVSVSCIGKTVSGGIPNRYGGYMYAGYNETCLKDPRPPRAYCNNVIANFTQVASIQDMPLTELCHTCNIRRLAAMQSSQYSIYDENYKEQLEYIYAQCKLTGPTAIPEPLDTVQPAQPSFCLSNKKYTMQQGDTCESIASVNSVSSAGLYMGNQDLLKDCANVTPGLSVCLPLTCVTHQLQESETCFSIERLLGLEDGMIRHFNSWLDAGCTNLQPATDFYGKIICVSPQGGEFKNPDKPAVPIPTSGPADGYMKQKVAPPQNATIAPGTTIECGKWHIVVAGDTCVKICLTNAIDTNLFHDVNPSLAAGTGCDQSLKEQTALCAGPTYEWKTSPGTSSLISSTTSRGATASSS